MDDTTVKICKVKKWTLLRAGQRELVVANLIGSVDELHALVGDREDDGRDFSHLFC